MAKESSAWRSKDNFAGDQSSRSSLFTRLRLNIVVSNIRLSCLVMEIMFSVQVLGQASDVQELSG